MSGSRSSIVMSHFIPTDTQSAMSNTSPSEPWGLYVRVQGNLSG